MKTTIDIADPILREARKLAQSEGTTLRALVEDGLRRVVSDRKKNRPYRFHPVTSGGGGLTPEAQQMSWSEIRDLSHRRGEE